MIRLVRMPTTERRRDSLIQRVRSRTHSRSKAAGAVSGERGTAALKEKPGDGIEALLGHKFQRPELLRRALTHRSLAYEKKLAEPDVAVANDPKADNEQLEFLGDAVLGFLVTEDLCGRYPELHEGELTRLRSELVSRKHLGQVAGRLTLGAHMLMGREKSAAAAAKRPRCWPTASKR